MRKVFLDDLPKTHKGIDWKNSVGYKVKFVYDDIEGEIEIVRHIGKGSKLEVIYDKKTSIIKTGSLHNCNIGSIIRKCNYNKKYKIGDVINVNNGYIKILDEIKENNKIYIKYECLTCGNVDYQLRYNLNQKQGCNVCSGKKIKAKINSMWATNPELAKLLANPDDGFKYTAKSSKKVNWKCPECGYILKNKIIANIYKRGLNCPKCSDGISYPEKVIINLLDQLEIEFIFQKVFKWSKNKIYDFYIPSLNCIIEVNGEQHYSNKGFSYKGGRTLKEEISNDMLKEEMAKNNGIKNYIILNCRKSEIEYIKKSILKSNLSNIMNLNNINWSEIDLKSQKSLLIKACNLWNNGIKSTTEIGEKLGLSRTTILTYLKKGREMNICDYNQAVAIEVRYKKAGEKARLSLEKNREKAFIKNKKKVICLNTYKIFDSIKDASESLGLKGNGKISEVCKGKRKSAGKHPETGEPLRWMYYEDYIKQNKIIDECNK